MTRMRIDAALIAQLGVSLGDVAANLEAAGDGDADGAAFPSWGEAQGAFDHLMEGWRRQRLMLVEQLGELSEIAQTAGTAYIEVESGVGRSLTGGVQ